MKESQFYQNVDIDKFILYEVNVNPSGEKEVGTVTIREWDNVSTEEFYSDYEGNNIRFPDVITTGQLGQVTTPKGKVVTETSAYAKIGFDIHNLLLDEVIRKTSNAIYGSEEYYRQHPEKRRN